MKLDGARPKQQPMIFPPWDWRNEELDPIWGLGNHSEMTMVRSKYELRERLSSPGSSNVANHLKLRGVRIVRALTDRSTKRIMNGLGFYAFPKHRSALHRPGFSGRRVRIEGE